MVSEKIEPAKQKKSGVVGPETSLRVYLARRRKARRFYPHNAPLTLIFTPWLHRVKRGAKIRDFSGAGPRS